MACHVCHHLELLELYAFGTPLVGTFGTRAETVVYDAHASKVTTDRSPSGTQCFIGLLWIVHTLTSIPSPHVPSVPDGRGAVVERVAVHRAWVGRLPPHIHDGLAAAMRHRHLAAAPLVCRRPPAQRHHAWRPRAEGELLPPCTAPLHSSSSPAPRSASSMGGRGCVKMPKRLQTGSQDAVPPVHRVAVGL